MQTVSAVLRNVEGLLRVGVLQVLCGQEQGASQGCPYQPQGYDRN